MLRKRTLEYHGLTKGGKQTPEYRVWSQMKQRCRNENHRQYHNYGGRGIGMDDLYYNSFTAFLDEVGPRPSKDHQIDRIDNSKGYIPGNMRWATSKQQNRNKRTNRLVKLKGQKAKPLIQVAEEEHMPKRRLRERLESGMSPDEAVSRPIQGGKLYFVWKGENLNLMKWAQRFKVPYWTLHQWVHREKKSYKKIFAQLEIGEWPGKGKPHRGVWRKAVDSKS